MPCTNSKNNYSVFDFISPVIEILALYMMNKKLYIFFKLFFSKTSCLLVTRKKKNLGGGRHENSFFSQLCLGNEIALRNKKKRENSTWEAVLGLLGHY